MSDPIKEAQALIVAKRYEEALAVLQGLEDINALVGRATCYYSLKRYTEALGEIDKCLVMRPDSEKLHKLRQTIVSAKPPEPARATAAPEPDPGLMQQSERSYAATREFKKSKEAKLALKKAQQFLPKVASAYSTSGKTTAGAVFGLIAATPFVSLAVIIGSIIPCAVYNLLANNVLSDVAVLWGILGLILDFVVMGIVCYVTSGLISGLAKKLKNRNATGPAILAFFSAFFSGLFVFLIFPAVVPLIGAAMDLTYRDLPLFYILIPIGVLIVPIIAAVMTRRNIADQKFCEQSGVFLDHSHIVLVALDACESALEFLTAGAYHRIPELPSTDQGDHCGVISLHWHPNAVTAYLEMQTNFKVQAGTDTVGGTWLSFSKQLTGAQAKELSAILAAETGAAEPASAS